MADATAFSLCMDNGMPILVFNLLIDGNIARAVAGEKIGTLVHHLTRRRREKCSVIDETLFDAEEKMEKAVSVARDDLSSIRTGRANPGMFSRITIDYYGSPDTITQLSSINVPEARLVVIKPYEAVAAEARSKTRSAIPISASTPPTTARSSGWPSRS